QDHLDDRVRGREDVEAQLGVPVLGVIPRARDLTPQKGLVTITNPEQVTTEAFRRLGTHVLHAAMQSDAKVLAITSSGEREGKTFTTANLGVVLARAGKKVILVSA